MKKLLLFSALTLIFLAGAVIAQEELPKPSIMPDSFLYGIAKRLESIITFFTFGDEAKANRYMYLAEKRLAEAIAMAKANKTAYVENLVMEYYENLNKSESFLAKVNRTAAIEKAINKSYNHIDVLQNVIEKVPLQAKPAIEKAINFSLEKCLTALEMAAQLEPGRAAKIMLNFTEKEMEKSERLFEINKTEPAQRRIQVYQVFLNKTEEMIEKQNITALPFFNISIQPYAELICSMTYKHIETLGNVYEKVSDDAKLAVAHAINVSMHGHEKCVEKLSARIEQAQNEMRKYNCSTDADCRALVCPRIIGFDTPICKERRCACGAKWEITNRIEWRERFGEELNATVQARIEKIKEIYNQTMVKKTIVGE